MPARVARAVAVASLVALVAAGIAWELWLAPLRPGGSWLVLKVVPLPLALRGMLHGRRYTFQWVSLLSLAYCMEGLARAVTDRGAAQVLAGVELALALALFGASIAFCRLQAGAKKRSTSLTQ